MDFGTLFRSIRPGRDSGRGLCRTSTYSLFWTFEAPVTEFQNPDHILYVTYILRKAKSKFSFFTVFGNMIILRSFLSNPRLRTMNNLYIMNLAIADFIIGLVKGTNNHLTIIQHHMIETHLVKMIT